MAYRNGASGAVSARSEVEPFLAMDVMSAAARMEADGRDVVRMEVGQPGAPAPRAVLDAATSVLADGRLGYTPALGRTDLRERIARHYGERYGTDVSPARVAVTTGSSAGFVLAFLAAFDAGARVAMAAPGYPAYRNILSALGLEAVEVPVGADTRFCLTRDHVSRMHAERPLAGVLVASPANPTGTMVSPRELRGMAEWCAENGVRFISDEIYHGLSYAGEEASAAGMAGAIVVNSFSKYYCMTGWRIGWAVLPDMLVRPLERLSQSLYISAPDLSQRAAVHAFDATAELDEIKASYARNRALLLERLPKLGFDDFAPADGAFYIYAGVSRLTNDSADFARRMLEEANVAATPGLDFDHARGMATIRFSFAGTEAEITRGLRHLEEWLA